MAGSGRQMTNRSALWTFECGVEPARRRLQKPHTRAAICSHLKSSTGGICRLYILLPYLSISPATSQSVVWTRGKVKKEKNILTVPSA